VKAFRLLQAEQPAMLVDVPKPKAGSGQVVIKVGGAGLCHIDGRYGATCVDLARLSQLRHVETKNPLFFNGSSQKVCTTFARLFLQ
jgi:hypothetical protein